MNTESWSAAAAIAAAVVATISAGFAYWQARSGAKSAAEAQRANDLRQEELEQARPQLQVTVGRFLDLRPKGQPRYGPAPPAATVTVTNTSTSHNITFDHAGIRTMGAVHREMILTSYEGAPSSALLAPGERRQWDIDRDTVVSPLMELSDDPFSEIQFVVYACSTPFEVPQGEEQCWYSEPFTVQT